MGTDYDWTKQLQQNSFSIAFISNILIFANNFSQSFQKKNFHNSIKQSNEAEKAGQLKQRAQQR